MVCGIVDPFRTYKSSELGSYSSFHLLLKRFNSQTTLIFHLAFTLPCFPRLQ